MLIYFHNGCLVTATVTVVRCAENSDNVPILGPIISLKKKTEKTKRNKKNSEYMCKD
jgi:hypothetical protein